MFIIAPLDWKPEDVLRPVAPLGIEAESVHYYVKVIPLPNNEFEFIVFDEWGDDSQGIFCSEQAGKDAAQKYHEEQIMRFLKKIG
jgi:hypothetical protein